MNSEQLASKILVRANELAPNSNFRIGGWDSTKASMVIQATIETLNENGLLSGCLLCRKEKETT